MERKAYHGSLINDVAASAADIDTTSMPLHTVITGLKPIPTGGIISVTRTESAQEVRQLITYTLPTIVAATKYSIWGGETGARDANNNMNKMERYGTTSDAVLSGTALTDKVNVAWRIGYKLLQAKKGGRLRATGGPTSTFTHSAGTLAIGDKITGITSGATGTVAVVTSGTVKVMIMTSSNDFTDTEAIKINGVITAITVTTNVYTGNLAILDDAGYNPGYGNRKGLSSWAVGENMTTIATTTAGVLGFGIGARLLRDVPVLESRSANLNSGISTFPTNNAPVSGNNYSRYVIKYTKTENIASSLNVESEFELEQELWVNEGDAQFADLNTALLAL